jgi:hypothetical protein
VTTVADLDRVLDDIVVPAGDLPYSVGIVIPDGSPFPVMLEVGIGHPERSFAYHVAGDGSSAWGYQDELDPVDGIVVNYAGTATDLWRARPCKPDSGT